MITRANFVARMKNRSMSIYIDWYVEVIRDNLRLSNDVLNVVEHESNSLSICRSVLYSLALIKYSIPWRR